MQELQENREFFLAAGLLAVMLSLGAPPPPVSGCHVGDVVREEPPPLHPPEKMCQRERAECWGPGRGSASRVDSVSGTGPEATLGLGPHDPLGTEMDFWTGDSGG